MSNISNLSKLLFFKVAQYECGANDVCDFREIPRPHYSLGLILRGTGNFTFNNTTVTVKRGDIIFVPSGATYISRWVGDPDILYVSAHFSFEAHTLFPRNKKTEIQKITLPEFDILENKFLKMLECFNSESPDQFSLLSDFYDVMSRVYPKIKYTETKKPDSRIEKATDYIELNYKNKIEIETLAKISNMSVSHFYACFKECTGISPIEYKHRISIRNAELLLVDDYEMSIEEISDILGYSSSIYFRELFKKITGYTPTQYRNHSKLTEFSNI